MYKGFQKVLLSLNAEQPFVYITIIYHITVGKQPQANVFVELFVGR